VEDKFHQYEYLNGKMNTKKNLLKVTLLTAAAAMAVYGVYAH
jgi:hypothetical protein